MLKVKNTIASNLWANGKTELVEELLSFVYQDKKDSEILKRALKQLKKKGLYNIDKWGVVNYG